MEDTIYNENIWKIYGGDPRELPLYGLAETSHYLKINRGTLRSWVFGRDYTLNDGTTIRWQPVINLPDPAKPELSFFNLVEVHVLLAIRRIHNVRFPKVRMALSYLEKEYAEPNPLARRDFWTDKFDLFVEDAGGLICASLHGQLVIREAIEQYLYRIERDFDLSPLRLYPFSTEIIFGQNNSSHNPKELGNKPKSILIDPLVAFGRPTIAGTGVPTNVIAGRFLAGEEIRFLAKDYEIKESQVKEALEYEELPRRAA